MILVGHVLDRLRELPDESVQVCCTSPPYFGLRKYLDDGREIGREPTPEDYLDTMVAVFREVRRVLKKDGTLWLNLGDSYAGSGKGPSKSLQSNASCIGSLQARTNKGSLSEKNHEFKFTGEGGMHRAHLKAGVIGNAWTPPPPGFKNKDLIGIPWLVAFALQRDGWWLRSDIVWHKPGPMPESVKDRPTRAHEYVFLLSKSRIYYYNGDAVKTPLKQPDGAKGQVFGGKNKAKNPALLDTAASPGGRYEAPPDGGANLRDVWQVSTATFSGTHFAVMPEGLVEPMILAGSRPGDLVLDPFTGSGTTWVTAARLGRRFIGVELNPEYIKMAHDRVYQAWKKVL